MMCDSHAIMRATSVIAGVPLDSKHALFWSGYGSTWGPQQQCDCPTHAYETSLIRRYALAAGHSATEGCPVSHDNDKRWSTLRIVVKRRKKEVGLFRFNRYCPFP